MTETEFQALFDSYQNSVRTNASDPIPQKIHLMVYNYALRRHQQSSDVSADFYLHMLAKLAGILNRYDPRRTPFYQYMAAHLNFEFSHFLRRRKLPRAQTELLSLEELATRRIELSAAPQGDENLAESLFLSLKTPQRIYARLALAFPLSFGELRQLIHRAASKADGWSLLRAYRRYHRYIDEKRRQFVAERDRLLTVIMRNYRGENEDSAARRRRESARRKFFSIDTRIPIRIVAEVTGEPIATVQRQIKAALGAVKAAHIQWEKHNLAAHRGQK